MITRNPRLAIIGNGFDLNCGLPTGYTDFINCKHFSDLVIKGNSLAKRFKKSHDINNWIDAEIELKHFARDYAKYEKLDSVRSDYEGICNALTEYLTTIDYNSIKENCPAVEFLKEVTSTHCKVLCFNYTKTIPYLIEKIGLKSLNEDRFIHMHGDLGSKNIIFGVEDCDDISDDLIYLLKSNRSNYKNGKLSQLLRSFHNIDFFGYSLGESDHTYFDDYFQCAVDGDYERGRACYTDVTFYHYKSKGMEEINVQVRRLTGNNLAKFKHNNNTSYIDVS
jgi:hypothetical protein